MLMKKNTGYILKWQRSPYQPKHFLWLGRNIINKSYIGQNAFGAKLPIILREEKEYYIIPLNNKSEIFKTGAHQKKDGDMIK